MTRRERVTAAVRGESVDRVPYSVWHHFSTDPLNVRESARATIDFAERYDPDLLKVMNDVPYDMPAGVPSIEKPEDWRRLPVLDGFSGGFGVFLDTLRLVRSGLSDDRPMVATVLGTYATAHSISRGRLLDHLGQDAESVQSGLGAIAASLRNHVAVLLDVGVDGIYLALSGAAADTQSSSEYLERFLSHESSVLGAVAQSQMNVAHQHGAGIYPELVLGMGGFSIYSWSNRLAGNPGIREMRLRTQACLMTGVGEPGFGERSVSDLLQEAHDGLRDSRGIGFILAPGCAVPAPPACRAEQLGVFAQAVRSRSSDALDAEGKP